LLCNKTLELMRVIL